MTSLLESDLCLVLTVKLCVGSIIGHVVADLRFRVSTAGTAQDAVMKVYVGLFHCTILLTQCAQDFFIAVNVVTWTTDVLLSVILIVILIRSKTGFPS